MTAIKRIIFSTGLLLSLSTNVCGQIEVERNFTNMLIVIGNISHGKVMNDLFYDAPGSSWHYRDRNAAGVIEHAGLRSTEHRLYCRIFKDKVTYGILIDTRHKLDDDLEFALGSDTFAAQSSLKTLLDFMSNSPLHRSIVVKDEENRIFQFNLSGRKLLLMEAIDAHGAEICSKVEITRRNLLRALRLLDRKAEKRVSEIIARNNP